VSHIHSKLNPNKPQVLLRAGEVTTVGPQLAGPNRSQAASERAMARQARAVGEYARTHGKDMTPTGLASRGTAYPRHAFSPALRATDFAGYGQRSGPLHPEAGQPWAFTPKPRPPAPGQLSLSFNVPPRQRGQQLPLPY
jgi:hypothetical protein